ncbi:putative 2-hydroxyacid dehydrogenase [Leucosporidium creatinivorum]|uniref:Putative 2-hydroxyacid dehydrogenase n=1 Tax=Leucosporidium creatinivorum TaxID=106004 RepID=A0A1Y2G7C5_9BASI|nr:putative 2-hydroxyacid dehydrogenase [Leucosporidium creatinivorum]
MSALKQVLICGKVHFATEELAALSSKLDILTLDSPDRKSFFEACKPDGKYGQVQAIYHNGLPNVGGFDKEFVDALPASLKIVAHHGAGYDPIDVAACSARGIQISNTPGAVDHGTATVALFLIISALRQFWNAQLRAHEGKFKQGTSPAVQNDPENKVLGIVGMGGIGRALAKRALGFDMKIIYHNRNPVDPSLLAEFPANSVTYCKTLDELLEQADVVSLHVPLNDKTNKFFGRAQFNKMKKGSCLVNTARGGVVDEDALLEALENGQLSSAGLDVFPNEPEINPKLLANDRLTLLPHMGTETLESRLGMESVVLKNIEQGLETGLVVNTIPEQKGQFSKH